MRRLLKGYMELDRRANELHSHYGWEVLWTAVHSICAFAIVFGLIALAVETNGLALILITVAFLGLFWKLGK